MRDSYDVIVAGAGMAGALASIAAARKGASVLMLDRNDAKEAGKKTNWGWVCGDAVAKSHVDFIEKELKIGLSEPELDTKVKGVYVLSPDMENKFMFEGAGYTLDRPKYARKMAGIAEKQGVEYMPRHEVEGPIIEGGKIVGVFGKDAETKHYEARAKVVVDALGIAPTLRRRLPQNSFVEKEVKIDDIESTGRYIANFDRAKSDLNYYDPDNALIHLNQTMAPGGYGWVFPKSNGKVNIGIGVEKNSLEKRNAKLGKKDSLHKLIDEYVEWNPVLKNMRIVAEDNNGKGYWSVTVRRQQDSLVCDNYIGAGDSMSMPNPISAGGIGPAMISGVLAGQTAAEAAASGDASVGALWKYNLAFNDLYGSKTAALEVFRVYLQSLNNDLINYGMSHFLTKGEAEALSYGRIPEITIASTFQKILSGVANINAFKNLLFTVNKMKRLLEVYKAYPESPAEFEKWRARVQAEMNEVKERFHANPV